MGGVKRIPQLDGVRGIAILLVLIWHYIPCQLFHEPGPTAFYVRTALRLMWSGVDLFFVLSGFLITGILLDNREASNYFRVFYVRRAARIFPLYFLLLCSFVCLSATPMATSPSYRWLFENPYPVWTYATFTQNVFMGLGENLGASWLAATWSLAVEEQFYLLVPVLVYFLSRRSLACVLVAAILSAPLLRVAFPGYRALVVTPWRSDSLLSGALLAVLVRWPPFLEGVRRHPQFVLTLFLLLLAGAAVLTLTPDGFGALNHFWLAGLYTTFVLIAFAFETSPVSGVLRSGVMVWLGKRSYGIYLFHEPVLGLLHGLVRQDAPALRSPEAGWITLLALGATLVLSELSYRVIEAPILRLAHRYRYSQQRPAQSDSPVAGEAKV